MAEKLTPEERARRIVGDPKCTTPVSEAAVRLTEAFIVREIRAAVEQARREEREKWVRAFSERITLESAEDVPKALTSWEHTFRRAQHEATLEVVWSCVFSLLSDEQAWLYHGCLSGDCPHEDRADCKAELFKDLSAIRYEDAKVRRG